MTYCSRVSFHSRTSLNTSRMKKKLIIDLDTGVDDAQAIMVALSDPDVEILAITCCYGNTPLENVLVNTLRVLKVCNRLDIPVYRGCSQPLLARKRLTTMARIKLVNQHRGEVSLVAMAPLTNLAVAVQLDPSFPEKLKALYIMGGNTDSRGNTTVCGEFNFVAHPEAAYVLLDRYTCPTYMGTGVPTLGVQLQEQPAMGTGIRAPDVEVEHNVLWNPVTALHESFCEPWLSQDTAKAAFMKKITRLSMEKAQSAAYQKEIIAGKGFNSCDTYAMAAAIDDDFIIEKEEVAVSVELEGTYTRGMMVLDYMELLKKKHKAIIMKKVDLEKFKQMFMNSLK